MSDRRFVMLFPCKAKDLQAELRREAEEAAIEEHMANTVIADIIKYDLQKEA